MSRATISRLLLLLILCFSCLESCSSTNVEFPRFLQDRVKAVALLQGMDEILIDCGILPAPGEKDQTCNCPGGGQVHVSGTVSNAGAAFSLVCQFTQCASSQNLGTFTAELVLDGPLSHQRDQTDSLQSDALSLTGSLSDPNTTEHITESCELLLEEHLSATSRAMRGSWCHRPVTWTLSHASCLVTP